jgi:DNA-binding Lrp family transcriptional regulator
MKKRVLSVFLELIKNSKGSDRDIAKRLKISQPTVTRIRTETRENGVHTGIHYHT